MKRYVIIISGAVLCLGIYLSGVFAPGESGQNSARKGAVPSRVVSINPAATEIIFELGCEDSLIAVSDFCDYPPEARELPRAGGVINPNLERLSMLEPDLIIIQGESSEIVKFCERRGIEYMVINLRDINELYADIRKIGGSLDGQQAAEDLCGRIQNKLGEIAARLVGAEKKKVFFSLYRTPGSLAGITTAGPNTLISELISIAGGINIFADVRQDYPVISKESLLKRQPEIIIESYSFASVKPEDAEKALNDWNKLEQLEAVQNGSLSVVDSDLVLKPGPRIARAAMRLAHIMHPEIFNNNDNIESAFIPVRE